MESLLKAKLLLFLYDIIPTAACNVKKVMGSIA